MGQGVDEARQQRELSKAALAGDLDRLEARVRAELDWRARLRRDGARYIALGAGVVLVVAVAGTAVILRRRGKRPTPAYAHPVTLEDLSAELHELRRRVEKKNGSSSLLQKALLRGLAAAGTAGGTVVARQLVKRQFTASEGTETARGG